jgi:hypothetical protein
MLAAYAACKALMQHAYAEGMQHHMRDCICPTCPEHPPDVLSIFMLLCTCSSKRSHSAVTAAPVRAAAALLQGGARLLQAR